MFGHQLTIFSDPVPVWRSVARWRREGCRGIVFLTGDWREMQPILCAIDQVHRPAEQVGDVDADIDAGHDVVVDRAVVANADLDAGAGAGDGVAA